MKRGKIICIAGTDCSGKNTQTKLLFDKLKEEKIPVEILNFPVYDTPTGKIIGGPYLGKEDICEGWFEEGATNVDPKVACLYYAADRRYSLPKINEILNSGKVLILDRYVESNLGHQAGKAKNSQEREKIVRFIEKLEYEMLELPKPDKTFFLHVPTEVGIELKKGREGKADQHERDAEHLIKAEESYLMLSERKNWIKIDCAPNGRIDSLKKPEEIHKEIWNFVKELLNE